MTTENGECPRETNAASSIIDFGREAIREAEEDVRGSRMTSSPARILLTTHNLNASAFSFAKALPVLSGGNSARCWGQCSREPQAGGQSSCPLNGHRIANCTRFANCKTWYCKTWYCKTWYCKTWYCKTWHCTNCPAVRQCFAIAIAPARGRVRSNGRGSAGARHEATGRKARGRRNGRAGSGRPAVSCVPRP